MSTPLLSVCLITYNHEKYIRQAIESVLMQKVDFDWELIIADDFSTDGTRNIVNEYQQKYPEFIKLILQTKNVGPAKNWIDLITAPNSKYIAYFEGDDYWTDPLKLQQQVDFLETHSDYSICFHDVSVLKQGVIERSNLSLNIPETTTILDLAKRNYIHTCSVVYRNHLVGKFPEYFAKAPVGDYYLHMLNAKYGKIKYFNTVMGVYRIHENSVWSSQQQQDRELQWLDFLKKIKPDFSREVCKVLNKQIDSYQSNHRNFFWYVRKIKNKIVSLTK